MRTTNYLLATQRTTPADAEVISHQLMLKAGLIRKVSAGLYTWLPTGIRVLKKVENIVREEMNKSGALEILMGVVIPAELWKESGRWDDYGPELLRFKDRNDRDFVLGPTHEEPVTFLFKNEVTSYKQLPLNLYQIQTKYRDEVRPRFGIMRSREFIMKDAYSFHANMKCLGETYDVMYQTYANILTRIGLDFRPVMADTGSIGGNRSHEFQVLADCGEDDIVFSTESNYAANIELAEAVALGERQPASQPLELKETPNTKTIADLVKHYNQPIEKTVKTLIVKGSGIVGHSLVALVLRGDHELNEIKAEKIDIVATPLEFATEAEIKDTLDVKIGSIGVINLPIPMIIDRSVATLSDFVCGANITGSHYFGVNWQRDVELPEIADLRNVVEGDPSPDGKGTLLIKKGIEVGHVFQLGDKYSRAMNATIQGEDGHEFPVLMGCYGIGVTRIVAAAIEQNYDEHGILWPKAIAPFDLAIIPVNYHKSEEIKQIADILYQQFTAIGKDVLLDDRNESAGVKFKDIDLIGIPHTIIIGNSYLEDQLFEYKNRLTGEKRLLSKDELINLLKINN